MAAGQADVFVQVERATTGEIKFLVAVHPDKVTIHGFHRAACGEAEDSARIRAHFFRDNPSNEPRRSFFVTLNDEFHERIKPNRLRLTTKNHKRPKAMSYIRR